MSPEPQSALIDSMDVAAIPYTPLPPAWSPDIEAPDINNIVTEDDTPVDNMFSAQQQRLLVDPLYSSWQPDRIFLATVNVGLFSALRRPPIVPDVFLSLDVKPSPNWHEKRHRSYFMWEFGKPPEVTIEIVSNHEGDETGRKMREYARIGVWYYVIFDPLRLLQPEPLRIYELRAGVYLQKEDFKLDQIGLGLTLWEGDFEETPNTWLRWTDAEGRLIPTGAERATQAQSRADRLAAQLKALGIEPAL